MSIPAKFVEGVKKLKVKDVAPYTKQFASEHLTPAQLGSKYNNWFQSYSQKYIHTGSPKPLWYVVCCQELTACNRVLVTLFPLAEAISCMHTATTAERKA